MSVDVTNITARLKAVLPTRWFPEATPVLDRVLAGLASAWAGLFGLLDQVRQQTRIATKAGAFLDGASTDFFGTRFPRRPNETDDVFRVRLLRELSRSRATRQALLSAVGDLTGRTPTVFEPARPADTGGYGTAALGYGVAGALGSLHLPYQVFVTAYRPHGTGIAFVAGYGTAGPLARMGLAQISGEVTDADINRAIASVLPTAVTAWTRITN